MYGLSWRDAPAEAAYLFHKRCQAFMANIIRGGKGAGQRAGPLGRVLHWVVRYEAQDRGSLHAHIILWVHPDDKARVASEIVACIPAVYRGNGSDPTCPTSAEYWEVPADPNAAALFAHVLTKQMHVCRPNGCCTAGACKYGFPTRPHTAAAPALDPATLRYQYYRPSWAHRNVSPYHPTVALLWGAHINLQVGSPVQGAHLGCVVGRTSSLVVAGAGVQEGQGLPRSALRGLVPRGLPPLAHPAPQCCAVAAPVPPSSAGPHYTEHMPSMHLAELTTDTLRVQVINSSNWSFYLLKYAMKVRCLSVRGALAGVRPIPEG